MAALPYIKQLHEILDFSNHQLSDIAPDVWAEKRMKVTKGKFIGPLDLNRTPYSREILNCFSPYHHATEVALMGGAQWGKTVSIIQPIIAYHISEHPCDMGYLTGHSDLSDESMDKLDSAIDDAGLRPLIKDTSLRKRGRTGDTSKIKKFPYGSLVSGSATNHKLLRQRSWRVILADDIEAAKGSSKESGSTIALMRARAKSFGNSKKILWCSTPELKLTSIIQELFDYGDQRRWHIPCPCCGTMIVLQWSVPMVGKNEKAGMVWKAPDGILIPESVGYICQHCGGFFDDSTKYEFNLAGKWIATAVSKDPNFISFHLPSLYSTPGMNDWVDCVREYLLANPEGQAQKEDLMKTFVNLTLGETFEPSLDELKATTIMKNKRPYEVGTVPDKMSMDDGNGRIILLTMAADMNGKIAGQNNMDVHDARIDYDIVAHSESGATYRIQHGSIGTFVPREGPNGADRPKWTYEHNTPMSVWPVFDEIRKTIFKTDTGREMSIGITGLDIGYGATIGGYPFLDKVNGNNMTFPYTVGVKGEKEEEYVPWQKDVKLFRKGWERHDIHILQVGYIKDKLSEYMNLRWDKANGDTQPPFFMNFPQSSGGLYELENYFEHFESEARSEVEDKNGAKKYRWKKKNAAVQNHQFDCAVYNCVLRDIFITRFAAEYKIKDLTWAEYVQNIALPLIK